MHGRSIFSSGVMAIVVQILAISKFGCSPSNLKPLEMVRIFDNHEAVNMSVVKNTRHALLDAVDVFESHRLINTIVDMTTANPHDQALAILLTKLSDILKTGPYLFQNQDWVFFLPDTVQKIVKRSNANIVNLAYVDSFLRHKSRNPLFLSDKGRILHKMGYLHNSVHQYRRALRIDGRASTNMGHLYTELGRPKIAARLYRTALLLRIPQSKKQGCSSWHMIDSIKKSVGTSVSSIETNREGRFINNLTVLKEIYISGKSGYVYSLDACEIYLGHQEFMNKFRYEQDAPLGGHHIITRHLDCDIVGVSMQGWAGNYYHFLVEIISKTATILQSIGYIFSPHRKICLLIPKFKRSFLEAFQEVFQANIESSGIHVHLYEAKKYEQIYLPSAVFADLHKHEDNVNHQWRRIRSIDNEKKWPSCMFVPSDYIIIQFRVYIAKRFSLPAVTANSIVYASRSGAKRISIMGENILIDSLKWKFGERLHLFKGSSMLLKEQSFVFSTAKFVIGPHGGALSNILFCAHGTVVIEFPVFPIGDAPYFMMLSKVLGMKYVMLPSLSSRYLGYTVINPRKVDLVLKTMDVFRQA